MIWDSSGALGILNILNETAPEKGAGGGPAALAMEDLGEAKRAIENANYKLLLEEIEFDEKCMAVYVQKVSNYEVRQAHQRDTWLKKRLEKAKQAVQKWFESKVGLGLQKSI